MDSRVLTQAELVTQYSLDISQGDRVTIVSTPVAQDLVAALYREVGTQGGIPVTLVGDKVATGARRAIGNYLDSGIETTARPAHLEALFDESDQIIYVYGALNLSELSEVPIDKLVEYYENYGSALQKSLFSTEFLFTQYPTETGANLAGMGIDSYEEYIWEAIDRDWTRQREYQEQLVEILDEGSEVQITSNRTDLRMSISGMRAINEHGNYNLPGGEVFISPVVNSVEGHILIDKPFYLAGREVVDAYFEFTDGEVTHHEASKNEAVLASVLDADSGARYVGELGIGMNADIDTLTYSVGIDEKMDETIHIALGSAFEECIQGDNERNESAFHIDMVTGMNEQSSIEVDGELVQRNGVFVFDDESLS